ncbi:DUF309 domain-containing protein [Mesorhizobium waimense]|uniref:DUF309 domain-containing protein n=2 Tax=Mesorhizobium waimense TaxID=1300307 RepID=A0A3A5K616_9HYPH|nr:DUF309 domain-containing protein [Mesorhizobium waimense]
MATGSTSRPRHLPEKGFPAYAYLPGRHPHPVRDPAGHSYRVEPMPVTADASLGSDPFLWGLDLFNHGYYWEAHEAWEGLWQVADRGAPSRVFFKALILLSAAGVKIREGKTAAAVRHSQRAAMLFRRLNGPSEHIVENALGLPPAILADYAEAATRVPTALRDVPLGRPQPVFDFVLGS